MKVLARPRRGRQASGNVAAQAQQMDAAKTAQAAAGAAKNLGQAAQAAGTVVPLENPQP
jgi:hypothetical protein